MEGFNGHLIKMAVGMNIISATWILFAPKYSITLEKPIGYPWNVTSFHQKIWLFKNGIPCSWMMIIPNVCYIHYIYIHISHIYIHTQYIYIYIYSVYRERGIINLYNHQPAGVLNIFNGMIGRGSWNSQHWFYSLSNHPSIKGYPHDF